MNVHLVDGTYELFRAFYAVPSAKNSAGLEVGAVRGLARSMLALLREPGASHVAVAFDHVIESFRNQLFDGYKTGEGIDPDLWGQFELAERACAALGIVVWPMIEFEADDALATAAAALRARARGRASADRLAGQGPRAVRGRHACGVPRSHAQEGARRSRRASRNSASARRRSPTTWRSSAIAPTASLAFLAGAQNRRRPC